MNQPQVQEEKAVTNGGLTPRPGRIFTKNIHITFPANMSGQPVICELSRKISIVFSILKAQITPGKEGFLTLQLEGEREACEQALEFLRNQGLRVAPAAQRIARNEDSCMHCGMCTAVCPTGALYNDAKLRMVPFDAERCTACGLCTKVCPIAAMQVDLEVSFL